MQRSKHQTANPGERKKKPPAKEGFQTEDAIVHILKRSVLNYTKNYALNEKATDNADKEIRGERPAPRR